MVCLGFEPETAGWWALTNPLSYGGSHSKQIFPWSLPTSEVRGSNPVIGKIYKLN